MQSLGDIVEQSIKDVLRSLFDPVLGFIKTAGDELLRIIVTTPSPNSVFEAPTNGAWPEIYTYYWDMIVPLALFLWTLSIGLMILLESTSHLFSNYHRTKLKKRAFSGLIGVLSWWWIAALSLRFIDELAVVLLPNLADIELFDVASFGAMGVFGLIIAATVDIVLFLLIALVYYMRQVVLYLYVLLMPILIALWVPGVGPFSLLSKFLKRLAGFYVPFLFMTIPIAILLQLSKLIGSSVSLSLGGIGQWLVAITIPFVAVVSPFVLFWQAGALFFMADRAARHASLSQARHRIGRIRSAGHTAHKGQQNLRRGLRGKPAVRDNGQTMLGSGDSRTHTVGSRLADAGRSLRSRLRTGNNQSQSTGSQSRAGQRNTVDRLTSDRSSNSTSTDDSTDRTAPDDDPRDVY